MFVTLFLLTFALSLILIPESQAYVVRTWAFIATLLPMWALTWCWWSFDASGHGLQMVIICL